MADDRKPVDPRRRKRMTERDEAIRRRRSNREQELRRGRSIPANDARRRVEDENVSRKRPQGKKRSQVRPSKQPKKKKKGIFKKVIGIILAAIILLTLVTGVRIAMLLNKVSTENIMAPNPVPMNQTVNILVLGLDVGDVKNPNDESIKRTDTMMLINFNPQTKKVNVVSIPRDTMIYINGRRWKINAAYPIGGDERVIKEVEELLSVNVNYLVKVNYAAFRDFINAIGGVDMKIKYDMNYTDKSQNLRINFKKGTEEHLDGKKAEEFFRWRKNNDGTGLPNGDIDRIKNQHEFLEQVVKKCTSPTIIFKMPKILKVMEQNIETNMPGTTIFKYALKMITLKSGNINMTTIKGNSQMIDGQSYFVFDKQANQQLINGLNSNGDSGPISPADVRIKVLNGTKISGLAATYKVQLNQLGYTNVDTGNTNLAKQSVVMVDNDNIKSELQKKFTSINKFESIDSRYEEPGYDVIVLLGEDAKNY